MAKRKSEELTKRPCDEGPASITAFIDDMNAQYEKVHVSFEDDFWATKMNLGDASVESLNATKKTYEAFLRDKAHLAAVREHLAHPEASEGQKAVLRIMERTFLSYIFESDDAVAIREQRLQLLPPGAPAPVGVPRGKAQGGGGAADPEGRPEGGGRHSSAGVEREWRGNASNIMYSTSE